MKASMQGFNRSALLLVCRHYKKRNFKAAKPRPLLFQSIALYPTWQHQTRSDGESKDNSIARLRWRTSKRIERLLIEIIPDLMNDLRNEIAVVANILESNLFETAPTREVYDDILHLRQRTVILLRYTARHIVAKVYAPSRVDLMTVANPGSSVSAMGA